MFSFLHYQDPLLSGLLSIFPVNLHDNNFIVEYSGKLKVLDMMLHQLHSQQSRDRIVLVSNYTKVVCTSALLEYIAPDIFPWSMLRNCKYFVIVTFYFP